jgi:signal transduction histidine kinase/tetratricopeptide (TPR) repeat protein
MGTVGKDRSFLDEVKSLLSVERGPDFRQITAALDRLLLKIPCASEAAGTAEQILGNRESPLTELIHALFWMRVGHWIRVRQILEPLMAREYAMPAPAEGFAWLSLATSETKLRHLEAARRPLYAEKTAHAQLKPLALLLEAALALKQLHLSEAQSRLDEARRALVAERAWSIPARLADMQGRIDLCRGQADSAMESFERAEELARTAEDSRVLCAALRCVARLNLLTENHAQVEKTIPEGLAVARQHHDWLGEAAFLLTEGDFFRARKDYEEAERKYEEAARINQALHYEPGRAHCAICLSATALAQRRREKARQHLAAAMQMADAMDIPSIRADAELTYALIGEADGAGDTEERYEKLKNFFADSPHGFRYVTAIFFYGSYLAKKGKITEAAALLAEAYEKATPVQTPVLGRIRDLTSLPKEQWAALWGGLHQRLRARNTELEETKNALEWMTRQRQGATAMLVHDLKNQMTPLLGALSLARQAGARLPLGEKDGVPLLWAYARTLTSRVESLTDYWRSELAGALEPALVETDIRQILENVQLAGELIAVSEVQWNLKASEPLPPIVCDPQQIERVFENLIFNARFYAQTVRTQPRYVHVEVAWQDETEELQSVVMNSGPIIPTDKLEEIFERFVRVSYEDREEMRDSIFNKAHIGLGLYYCRQPVGAHGGRIWADNLEDGSGVRFTFVLPRYPPSWERPGHVLGRPGI